MQLTQKQVQVCDNHKQRGGEVRHDEYDLTLLNLNLTNAITHNQPMILNN